jgi:hypothetical protein
MKTLFTKIDQITPEWLTACLRDRGVLQRGHVLTVEGDSSSTIVSTVGTITVSYSADAPASAPVRLFFKTGVDDAPENDDMAGEVRFYQHLAGEIEEHTVYCYDAAYATDPARFHLLLADLSETHSHTQWPLPPTLAQLEGAIDCLAAIHARWWEHRRFSQDVQRRYNQSNPSLTTWVRVWEEQLAQYLDFLGDRLSTQRRATYEWALPRVIPLLMQRHEGGNHFTLILQDAHHYNFLFPHNPAADTTRLVDWATWEVGLGGRDLAYLIALFFFPEQRGQMEQSLLRRYHDALIMRGVRNYDWESLWYDYRLYVISNLFIPVEQFVFGTPARVWWLHAERSFLAFEDLKCAELLT